MRQSDSRGEEGGHDWLYTRRRIQADETTTSRCNDENEIR